VGGWPASTGRAMASLPWPARRALEVGRSRCTNLSAGYDGWVLLGTQWATLEAACAATGFFYRRWSSLRRGTGRLGCSRPLPGGCSASPGSRLDDLHPRVLTVARPANALRVKRRGEGKVVPARDHDFLSALAVPGRTASLVRVMRRLGAPFGSTTQGRMPRRQTAVGPEERSPCLRPAFGSACPRSRIAA